MALGAVFLWISNFLVTFTFGVINDSIPTNYVWVFFAVVCVTGGTCIYFFIQESRDVDCDEVLIDSN